MSTSHNWVVKKAIVSGNLVTLVATGVCTLVATQPGMAPSTRRRR